MALTTFQCIIAEIFEEYISAFVQVFLNNFAFYEQQNKHLAHLHLCLEQRQHAQLGLNPAKCVFYVSTGALLSHIVSRSASNQTIVRIRVQTKTIGTVQGC